MRLVRAWLVIVVAMASVASAANAPPLLVDALDVQGSSSIDGAAAALFLLVDGAGLSWDATAASVGVARDSANYTSVQHPAAPGSNLYSHYEPSSDALAFGPATLTSTAAREGGALLVLGQRAAQFSATTDALLSVRTEESPTFEQAGEWEVEGAGSRYVIHEKLEGTYLGIVATDGSYEIRGDLVLHLSEVDYRLRTSGDAFEGRTGWLDETANAGVRSGHVERHTLTLLDAVLRIHVPGEARVYTPSAVLAFDGQVRAHDPQGHLVLGDAVALGESTPTARGAATVDLAPEGAQVKATGAPVLSATSGARAPIGPAMPAWLALLAVVALAATAIVVALRRRARVDPLDAAVLAMEERRWQDALPHLDQLLAKRPDDAGLLVDRAICLEESGRLHQAREGYERALRLAPANADAHFYYARTLARLRDAPRARTHLARALALDPRFGELAGGEAAFRAL